MKEFERKYKLKYIPLITSEPNNIKQGYLFYNDTQYLRVRLSYDSNLAFMCYKENHLTSTRDEYEAQISIEDGIQLFNSAPLKLYKTRFHMESNHEYKIDIDLYANDIGTVDIECKEEFPNDFIPPDYCGEEITDDPYWTTYAIAQRLASDKKCTFTSAWDSCDSYDNYKNDNLIDCTECKHFKY